MLGASRRFLNLDYLANGARGPILLYSEVQDRFAVRSGNSTSMYWDTVKAYQATISITLWVTASCELHKQVRRLASLWCKIASKNGGGASL